MNMILEIGADGISNTSWKMYAVRDSCITIVIQSM